MNIGPENAGSVLISVIRSVSSLIPLLNAWVMRKGQEYKEQAEAAQSAGNIEQAEKCFEQALAWLPEDADLHSNLGQIYYDRDKFDLAEKQFRQALSYSYGNLPALKGLGLLLQERGDDLSEPMYLYLRYLQSNPKDAVVCHNLGTVFHDLGHYESAVEYYARADEEEPNDPLTLRNYALALIALEKFEEAKTKLLAARDLAPDDAEVDQLLGSTYEALGDNETAMNAYETSLQKDPKNADTHLQAASVALNLRRNQDGAAHARKAAELYLEMRDNTSAAKAYWELGWIYYMLGEFTKSIEASSQALSLNPELTPVHFSLGLALLKLGRNQEALKEYQQGAALAKLSDLKEHGIDDLRDAIENTTDNAGAREILDMLEARYDALSRDVARSAKQAT